MANKTKPENFSGFCAILRNKLTGVAKSTNQVFLIDESYLEDNTFRIGIYDLGDAKLASVAKLLNLKKMTKADREKAIFNRDNAIEADQDKRYFTNFELPPGKFPEFKKVTAYVHYTVSNPDLIIDFELTDKKTAFINNEQAHELARYVIGVINHVRYMVLDSKLSNAYFPEEKIIGYVDTLEPVFETTVKSTNPYRLYFGKPKPKLLTTKLMKIAGFDVGFVQFHLVNFMNPDEVMKTVRRYIEQAGQACTIKKHSEDLITVNVYFKLDITIYSFGSFLLAFGMFCEALLYAQRKTKSDVNLNMMSLTSVN